MSFIGSSERWGDQATARLCQLIVESNDGMAQQIVENRTDLLDILSKEELERTDDLGLTLPFLAIYYDQPDALKYLHKRGLDLSIPCDPMNYGTPMFYATYFGRPRLVEALYALGYSANSPCETAFSLKPLYYAERRDDRYTKETLQAIILKEEKALVLFNKNLNRNRQRRLYLKMRKSILRIQTMMRGWWSRRWYKLVKSGNMAMGSASASLYESSQSQVGDDDNTSVKSGSVASSAVDNGSQVSRMSKSSKPSLVSKTSTKVSKTSRTSTKASEDD